MADYTDIQQRRDTPENWTSFNPVLPSGTIGYEMTGNPPRATAEKIGDGVTAWADLPYSRQNGESLSYVIGCDYATISAAVAGIGTKAATLQYGTNQAVTADLTVPANIELMPMNGAIITVDSGKTLTYKGSVARFPTVQIFAGAGAVAGLAESDPLWFGAKADCVLSGTLNKISGTDNFTAFRKAIDSLSRTDPYSPQIEMYAPGGRVHVRKGTGAYYISATLEIKHPVIIEGDGSGQQTNEASYLWFSPDVTGFIIQRYNTSGTGTDVGTTAGDATILRGLSISSHKGSDPTKHGVHLRARAIIEDCYIQGFSGNGINIVASAGSGGATEGNANNFAINRVVSYGNGQNGLYVSGADVNAGTIIALDSEYNGQWGVYDHSFLGNTYVGCHVNGNTVGSYLADSATAGNIFIGCYSESGWPSSKILLPSMVVGGLHGAGFTADSDGSIMYGGNGGLYIAPAVAVNAGADANIKIGGGTDTLMVFSDNTESSGVFPFRMHRYTGGFYFDWANNNNKLLMFYNTKATTGNGFPRTIAAGALGLGEYYFGPSMALHTYAAAMPTTGSWRQGDVVWNTAPTAGNPVGYWLRLTTGSGNVLDTDWKAK